MHKSIQGDSNKIYYIFSEFCTVFYELYKFKGIFFKFKLEKNSKK
jgi:hypothetical protein